MRLEVYTVSTATYVCVYFVFEWASTFFLCYIVVVVAGRTLYVHLVFISVCVLLSVVFVRFALGRGVRYGAEFFSRSYGMEPSLRQGIYMDAYVPCVAQACLYC